MTIKGHILRTASEIAMGRYMRAPDHPQAEQTPTAEAPAAETPPADVDEFAAAFENLTKEDEKVGDDKGGKTDGLAEDRAGAGAGAGAGDGTDADSTAGPGDGGAGDAAGEKGKKGKAASKADDTKPADAPPAVEEAKGGKTSKDKEPAPAETDDILKRLADVVRSQPAEEKKPEPAAEEKPLFSTEEEAKITKFKEEWPEVAEAFDLQSRAIAHSVLKYAFSSIAEEFIPLRQMVEAMATKAHYGELKNTVGEYTDAERGEIVDWVKAQPAYLQTAMMSVIEEGTVDEVADLINRYREATGKQPAGVQEAKAEAPGGDTELSGEAKQAAAALAPVSSKRSAVQAPDDSSDFDGAFAKFADQL